MLRLILIALLLGVVLAACGGSPQTTNQVSFIVWGDPSEKVAYERLAEAFEQRSDVDITLTHIPGQNDYRRRIAADFSAGQPANLMLINYRRMSTFAAKDALEPLGPYLDRSSVIKESDFFPEPIAAFRYNGTLVCIPQNVSSLVVYYNKQLFDQAGQAYPADDWTLDDFIQTAVALTKDTNGDGQIDQYGVGIDPSAIRLAPFIWQNGGQLVDNQSNPSQLTIDTPEAVEAAQWFVDLQIKHRVTPDAIAAESEDNESRFQNGRTAMLFESRRAVPTLRTINTFDWDVAPLPRGKQQVGILHSDAYCMSAKTQNKEAAWKFVEFANSPEGQAIIAKTGRTVPSLRAVAQSPSFLEPGVKPERSAVFLDAVPTLRALPTMNAWEDIESILDNEIERAFYGQATVVEAMQAARTGATRFFQP